MNVARNHGHIFKIMLNDRYFFYINHLTIYKQNKYFQLVHLFLTLLQSSIFPKLNRKQKINCKNTPKSLIQQLKQEIIDEKVQFPDLPVRTFSKQLKNGVIYKINIFSSHQRAAQNLFVVSFLNISFKIIFMFTLLKEFLYFKWIILFESFNKQIFQKIRKISMAKSLQFNKKLNQVMLYQHEITIFCQVLQIKIFTRQKLKIDRKTECLLIQPFYAPQISIYKLKSFFLLLNKLFIPQMNKDKQTPQYIINYESFREITNIQKNIEKNRGSSMQKQTLHENKFLKKNQKHMTVPAKAFSNQCKITHFEKLINSKVSDVIKQLFIIQLYKGVKYSFKSLKGPSQAIIQKKKVRLNEIKGSKKKFLFLDLDQTLIYTKKQKKQKKQNPENVNAKQIKFNLHIRPYAQQFLQIISKYYDVYVFTAATREYAEAAIQRLNQRKKNIQDFLCREHCFETQRHKFIKDLRIVANRSLNDIILIDNKAQSFGLQIDNGIPILEFYGHKHDTELINLQKILIQMADSKDVRIEINNYFKLKQLGQVTKEELQNYLKCGTSMGRSQTMIQQHFNS